MQSAVRLKLIKILNCLKLTLRSRTLNLDLGHFIYMATKAEKRVLTIQCNKMVRKCANYIKSNNSSFKEFGKSQNDIVKEFCNLIGMELMTKKQLLTPYLAREISQLNDIEIFKVKKDARKIKNKEVANNIKTFNPYFGIRLNEVDKITYNQRVNSKPSRGESAIIKYLENRQLIFIREFPMENMRNELGNLLYFDFFLPEEKIAIEFDGQGHFNSFGQYYKKNDFEKDKFCQLNGIHLIRIKFNQYNAIPHILSSQI